MGIKNIKRTKNACDCGHASGFVIRMGVHQGSTLYPLLSITAMEEATNIVRGDCPRKLIHADYLV